MAGGGGGVEFVRETDQLPTPHQVAVHATVCPAVLFIVKVPFTRGPLFHRKLPR